MKHGETHKLKDEHKIFIIKNFDNNCFEHNGNTVIGYCNNHNKNYCLICEHFEENNKKIDEILKDSQINYYENEMNKNKQIQKQGCNRCFVPFHSSGKRRQMVRFLQGFGQGQGDDPL